MSTVLGHVSVREAQERLLSIEQKLKQQSTIPVGVLLATMAQVGCTQEGHSLAQKRLRSSFQKGRGAGQARHADRHMPCGTGYGVQSRF